MHARYLTDIKLYSITQPYHPKLGLNDFLFFFFFNITTTERQYHSENLNKMTNRQQASLHDMTTTPKDVKPQWWNAALNGVVVLAPSCANTFKSYFYFAHNCPSQQIFLLFYLIHLSSWHWSQSTKRTLISQRVDIRPGQWLSLSLSLMWKENDPMHRAELHAARSSLYLFHGILINFLFFSGQSLQSVFDQPAFSQANMSRDDNAPLPHHPVPIWGGIDRRFEKGSAHCKRQSIFVSIID